MELDLAKIVQEYRKQLDQAIYDKIVMTELAKELEIKVAELELRIKEEE